MRFLRKWRINFDLSDGAFSELTFIDLFVRLSNHVTFDYSKALSLLIYFQLLPA